MAVMRLAVGCVFVGVLALFLLVRAETAIADVAARAVPYVHGEMALEGWLVHDPARSATAPGVLLVHEWRGLDDHVKEYARRLAEQGYAAFALDMYGKGVLAANNTEAAALAKPLRDDRPRMRQRAAAGLQAFLATGVVDPARVAAIGFCFGGTTVLEMARDNQPLRGVVSLHGGLKTPLPATGTVSPKVLVLHGAVDPHVPPEEVIAFGKEMEAAKADWQLVAYGKAVHSFTNPKAGDDPSKGAAYEETAARRAWRHLLVFLEEALGN